MNKRGISPLIATVLIIGFVIIGSILVINFINNLTQGQLEETGEAIETASTGIDYEVSFKKQYSGSKVRITNKANIDLRFLIQLGDEVITTDFIPAYSVQSYFGDYSEIVTVTPVIEVDGKNKSLSSHTKEKPISEDFDNFASSFDGTGTSFVEITHDSSLNLNSMTLMAWVNRKGNSDTIYPAIISKGTVSPAYLNYLLGTKAGTNEIYFTYYVPPPGGWEDKSSLISINNDEWSFVAVTVDWNLQEVYLYINGQKTGPIPLTWEPLTNNRSLKIGMAGGAPGKVFNGYIDEVKIWNRALSENEINAHIRGYPDVTDLSLVGYWNFNEGSGDVVKDLSSYKNDGVIVGNIDWVSSSEIPDQGDDLDPGAGIVWETGRPTCEHNCMEMPTGYTEIYPESAGGYGHNDFTFFRDQDGFFRVIAIKSMKDPAGGYYSPYGDDSENIFVHYKSNNMVTWQRIGDVIPRSSNPSDPDGLSVWAPHVVEKDGTYYLFYAGVVSESCPSGTCITQRIMLAINGGGDLDDPSAWIKQGVVLECDAPWSAWQDAPNAWSRACRDPMIYEISENNYIMYFTAVPDDSLGAGEWAQVVGYAHSNDLITWTIDEYIPDTIGALAEGPFLFKKNNEDKYYLHVVGTSTFIADEVVDINTPLSTTTSFDNPTEFLYVSSIENLEDGPFLIKAYRVGSLDREIDFQIYDINPSTYSLELFRNSGDCISCYPDINILSGGESCEYDQDCSSSSCSGNICD